MKRLHFLRWPLVLLLTGYLVFLVGNFLNRRHRPLAEECTVVGYVVIIIAVVWIIIKFILLKPPEDETN